MSYTFEYAKNLWLKEVVGNKESSNLEILLGLNKNYSSLTYTMYWCAYSKLITGIFVDIMFEDERVCGSCPVREACQRNIIGRVM